jgi:hypothetical protein
MEAKEIINKIKGIVGIELSADKEPVKVELMESKLDNGTVITYDELKEGSPVFIVSEDENIALPVGRYEHDGKILVVEEDGVIARIQDGEVDVDVEVEVEEDMADVGDWEGMEKRIQNLEDAVSSLKTDHENMSKIEVPKETLSAIEVEAEPIYHSPETKADTKVQFKETKNPDSILNRVFNTINK